MIEVRRRLASNGGVSNVLPLIAGYKTFDKYTSQPTHRNEEDARFQDFETLFGGEPVDHIDVDSAVMGTSMENFVIKGQRRYNRNSILGLNMVNPDNITENQRRNITNGAVISNATGWVEIKIDQCYGNNDFLEDSLLYFMWRRASYYLTIVVHFYDNNKWLGSNQIHMYQSKSKSDELSILARIPDNLSSFGANLSIYIDIAHSKSDPENVEDINTETPLTKQDVISNLMIVYPSEKYMGPFDTTLLYYLYQTQRDAPYIPGLNFELYSDYVSPSPNHPCDIPVTKCPEGYTAVLGIGNNSVENLQKFNFPSDLELYPGEYINLNEMKAHKFSKKFTIDSTTSFTNVSCPIHGGTINLIKIDKFNPFGFSKVDNVTISEFNFNILSNCFYPFFRDRF